MRTSNKIILGIFVAPLLAVTLVHVALYAKIKSGHFQVMKTVIEDALVRNTYPAVTKVAVYGLNRVTIRPSDSLKLETEKNGQEHFHYTASGDSLVIHGDSLVRRQDGSMESIRSYQDVHLYLPSGVHAAFNNTGVIVSGSADSLKAPSYQFVLVNGGGLQLNDPDGAAHGYFKELSVTASHTEGVQLSEHSIIADLQVSLIASLFNDNGASIGALKMDADNNSDISIKGGNLKKIK